MDYLLDSNACIIYMNGRSPELKQQLESQYPKNIYVCSVVKAELYYGALRTRHPVKTLRVQNEFLNQKILVYHISECAGAWEPTFP